MTLVRFRARREAVCCERTQILEAMVVVSIRPAEDLCDRPRSNWTREDVEDSIGMWDVNELGEGWLPYFIEATGASNLEDSRTVGYSEVNSWGGYFCCNYVSEPSYDDPGRRDWNASLYGWLRAMDEFEWPVVITCDPPVTVPPPATP